jgi:hypothetical protein
MAAPASMSPADAAGLAGVADLAGDASFAASVAGFRQPMPARKHTTKTYLLLKIECLFMGTRAVTSIAGGTILVVVAT